MPTIISGMDPEARMNAYLAGQKFQTGIQEQQAEEEREISRQRLEFMKAMQDFRVQEAKALKDVNERAQRGQAQAMQQQLMAAQAAGIPADQKMAMEAIKILGSITDPEVRATASKDVQAYLERLQKENQRKASMDIINAGSNDGLIDPELAKQRIASGEEPETIALEIKKARDKRDEDALNMQESTEAMEYAQHTLAGLPKGSAPWKRVAKVIQKFSGAPTAQRQKGAGKAFRDQVLRAAAFHGEEEAQSREQAMQSPMPSLGGMTREQMHSELGKTPHGPIGFGAFGDTFGAGVPDIPQFTGGTHSTLMGTNRKPQGDPFAGGPIGYSTSFQEQPQGPQQGPPEQMAVVQDLLGSSKSPEEFRAKLKARGIIKTPEVAKLVAQFRNAAPATE